jgi:hypothetical protein
MSLEAREPFPADVNPQSDDLVTAIDGGTIPASTPSFGDRDRIVLGSVGR